ncbi:MAG: hypothetical protein A2252_00300 [Elusimicrobia bacterium RIFOXYA2_FULL_39_19]|nr:MAG: hypothetical protein A2252_00300 [Elusimicrobia bacterium RIFOXYA2_FULL_39_19]
MILIINPQIKKTVITAFKPSAEKSISFDLNTTVPYAQQRAQLKKIAAKLTAKTKLKAIAFRLHYAGKEFEKPVFISKSVIEKFAAGVFAFPLYMPQVINSIELFMSEIQNVPCLAFFETSFFSGLPENEKSYPIGKHYFNSTGIEKRGYHGIWHEENAGMFGKNEKIISVVLDKQTTVCSIQGRKPMAVSLGYTPLEGIMSLKSCGDIDPGIAVYLMKEQGYSVYKIDDILKNESGFYGMTGNNMPIAELIQLYGRDDSVKLAFDVYKNQILKYIGDAIAVLHGFDRIIFAGGNVKPLSRIIYRIMKDISFLGLSIGRLPWEYKTKLIKIASGDSLKSAYINSQSTEEILFKKTKIILSRKG